MPRLWLDITGVGPGSDAAWLAASLGHALCDLTDVTVCERTPSLQPHPWDILASRCAPPPEPDLHIAPPAPLGLAQRLPAPTRAAIRRFAATQRAAIQAWSRLIRPTKPPASRSETDDQPGPVAGDTLLMLHPNGDAARFAAQGVRLVWIATDAGSFLRPDWQSPRDATDTAIWQDTTAPLVTLAVTWSPEDAIALNHLGFTTIALDAAAIPPDLAMMDSEPDCILALGEISEAGQTRHLLLAWRNLLDTTENLPKLVLAGPIGALADDVLAQLRNSRMFDGTVRLIAHPTPAEIHSLLATCRRAIAPSTAGWGRARWDALAAGRSCVTSLHDAIASPQLRSVPATRDWKNVAADLLEAFAQ